jgi:hypothetical protein
MPTRGGTDIAHLLGARIADPQMISAHGGLQVRYGDSVEDRGGGAVSWLSRLTLLVRAPARCGPVARR